MIRTRKPDQRPSWQFYPDDWLSDANLRLCSSSAKGLWIDLLCVMFRMEERGMLRVKGRPLTEAEASRLVSRSQAQYQAQVKQLVANGVCESLDDGTIYSRRMVREEKQRLSKVEAGRMGGRQAKRRSPSSTPSSTPSSKITEAAPPVISEADDHAKRLAVTYRTHSAKKQLYAKAVECFREAIDGGLNEGDIEAAIMAADKLAPPWEIVNALRKANKPAASMSFAEQKAQAERDAQAKDEAARKHWVELVKAIEAGTINALTSVRGNRYTNPRVERPISNGQRAAPRIMAKGKDGHTNTFYDYSQTAGLRGET